MLPEGVVSSLASDTSWPGGSETYPTRCAILLKLFQFRRAQGLCLCILFDGIDDAILFQALKEAIPTFPT